MWYSFMQSACPGTYLNVQNAIAIRVTFSTLYWCFFFKLPPYFLKNVFLAKKDFSPCSLSFLRAFKSYLSWSCLLFSTFFKLIVWNKYCLICNNWNFPTLDINIMNSWSSCSWMLSKPYMILYLKCTLYSFEKKLASAIITQIQHLWGFDYVTKRSRKGRSQPEELHWTRIL